jgi:hypothetical protein
MPTRCNRCFLLQILLLAQHVSGTIMPIIRSSRVLYSWLPPVVFGVWFSCCRYGMELRVVSGLRAYAHHQELESIIQLVADCGLWCLVFKLSVWRGAKGCASVCGLPGQPANSNFTI